MNILMSREVRQKIKIDWRGAACSAVIYVALAVILILAIPAMISFACIWVVWTTTDKLIIFLERSKR